MRSHRFLVALTAVSPLLAQLPAPTLISRTAPRAAWSVVTAAGTTTSGTLTSGAYPATVNTTFRAGNPGAASQSKLWVFGGSLANNTATTTNDLWAFDAVAGTFTQVLADGAAGSPSARARAAIAWNPVSNKLVVFGGNTRGTTPTLLNDTWEYDPSTNVWANVTPASGNPTPRQLAAMAYEPLLGGMLLFGGQTNDVSPAAFNNETWQLLGGTWVQFSPANVPAQRAEHSLVTRDDEFHDVLLTGGLDTSSAAPDQIRFLDVWKWTGSDWNLLSNYNVLTGTGGTWPASSNGNQAVYDPLRKRVVVQGGNGISVAANVTYLYGTAYAGSPTNYTSEFDCLTNSWSIYANATTGTTPYNNTDPAIGRVSRYYAGFVAATGKIYKACGQDPTKTGSRPTNNVYQYQAVPMAQAPAYGAGCAGSGGPMSLSATRLPWSSRTCSLTAAGFAVGGLGFGCYGFTQATTPLSVLLPAGGPGCSLLLNPDVTSLLLPIGGTSTMSLVVPAGTAYAGLVLNAQAIGLEFDGSGNVSLMTSSNGIALTIGAL